MALSSTDVAAYVPKLRVPFMVRTEEEQEVEEGAGEREGGCKVVRSVGIRSIVRLLGSLKMATTTLCGSGPARVQP